MVACLRTKEKEVLNRLTSQLDFHGQALMLRSERQRVLAGNIANADTPEFKARDFNFTRALSAASGDTGAVVPTRVAKTSSGHMQGPSAGSTVVSTVELAWRTPEQPSLDGNTVDLDRERANFADNATRYEATLRFINGNVRTMLSAITGQ
jgi:flagellar basal-body rod protein FlgB